MNQDIPDTRPPTLSMPLPSSPSSQSFSETPVARSTPTPTLQSRRRSPTRKASSAVISSKPNPLPKPRKQRQLTINAPSSQPTQSTNPRESVQGPTKPAMHLHRMLRAEVPEDAVGVQVYQYFSLIVPLL